MIAFKNAMIYLDGTLITRNILYNGARLSFPEDRDFEPYRDSAIRSCILLPGLCDARIHLPSASADDVKAASDSAAQGGFTSVCLAPDSTPVPDSPESLAKRAKILSDNSGVQFLSYGALTVGGRGEKLTNMEQMSENALAFAVVRQNLRDDAALKTAMRLARKLGKTVILNCASSSREETAKYLRLALETECALHLSCPAISEAFTLIRRAKRAGIDVSCELSPEQVGAGTKPADRDAALLALSDGTADMLVSNGTLSPENSAFFFARMHSELVRTGIITPERLVELLSVRPRRRFKIHSENDYAFYEIGTDFSAFSPSLRGKCLLTLRCGQEIYRDERLKANE